MGKMVAGKNSGLEAAEGMSGDGDDGGTMIWRRRRRKGGRSMGTTTSQ